eukprot:TRINITY_DN60370_c0_g1_i2.p3 TRINITY_DN60370_c0_g1~~TRINITY_DN60370_c0_g1_i2.p3  ORF type:complete len:125 (-),score=21.53 TRINITY_DN60370_c0_g1_i2:261-635(-)
MNAVANTWSDKVHVIAVYTVEAHPKKNNSPYSGKPWEFGYSTIYQAYTYPVRTSYARTFEKQLSKNITLLVDNLDTFNKDINPVWCTYGPAPNGAWLIHNNGGKPVVKFAQPWFKKAELEAHLP